MFLKKKRKTKETFAYYKTKWVERIEEVTGVLHPFCCNSLVFLLCKVIKDLAHSNPINIRGEQAAVDRVVEERYVERSGVSPGSYLAAGY